jgi:hypothetical protein
MVECWPNRQEALGSILSTASAGSASARTATGPRPEISYYFLFVIVGETFSELESTTWVRAMLSIQQCPSISSLLRNGHVCQSPYWEKKRCFHKLL